MSAVFTRLTKQPIEVGMDAKKLILTTSEASVLMLTK